MSSKEFWYRSGQHVLTTFNQKREIGTSNTMVVLHGSEGWNIFASSGNIPRSPTKPPLLSCFFPHQWVQIRSTTCLLGALRPERPINTFYQNWHGHGHGHRHRHHFLYLPPKRIMSTVDHRRPILRTTVSPSQLQGIVQYRTS